MPRLLIKNLSTQEEQIFNLSQDLITLGRTSSCDIELSDKSISRKHAEILQEGDDYFLIDLKSGNGTLLNGKKIRAIEKHLLRAHDVIKIENYEIHFTPLEENTDFFPEEDTDTDIIEVKMIKKVLKALNKESAPSLEILHGKFEGKKIIFTENLSEILIGRDPECQFSIDDPVISRNHAKLSRKWGGIVLTDLDSRNSCYVNNEKIEEKVLRDGDKIMLGTLKLLYRNPQDVNVEAIGAEISRKKKEAALREAELMEIAHKQQEEAKVLKEGEAADAEEEAPLEIPDENANPEDAQEIEATVLNSLSENPGLNLSSSGKFSLAEKVLMGVGVVVFLAALVAIVLLLMK